MKYIVAVSGGVDSVVLLDMVAKKHPKDQLVVAHFEHGIRGEESKNDERFVKLLAQKYGLEYIVENGELAKNASEAEAREKRYDFLHRAAEKYSGQIVTAHHQDDLIETVALNIQRGTGWRGLTPLADIRIIRPLLGRNKKSIYDYALRNNLEWVEDSTNASDAYTRNRLRKKMQNLSQEKVDALLKLHRLQFQLRKEIEAEGNRFILFTDSRYFLTMVNGRVAMELLRAKTKARLTRPQLERLLLAIKTSRPGTEYQPGAGITVQFTSRDIIVEQTSRML